MLYSIKNLLLKACCTAALVALCHTGYGRYRFYVQAGGGYSLAYIKESVYRGKAQPGFTANLQCGISSKHLVFGYAITGQRITQKVTIPLRDNYGTLITTKHIDFSYGNLLVTNELSAHGKFSIGKFDFCLGPIIGFSHTTGEADNEWGWWGGYYVNTKGNYGGGWGGVFGADVSIRYNVSQRLSVQAQAAYKAVSFAADVSYYDYIETQNFRLSLIPFTAGVRVTF